MNTKINVISNSSKEGSIRVAFGTNDLENIDAHFGGAHNFAMYDIDKESYEMVQIVKMKDIKGTEATIDALKGVDIVYFTNIGQTAAAKVINAKIFPIKYREVVSIESELEKLKAMLNENPPPFIKKIIERKSND